MDREELRSQLSIRQSCEGEDVNDIAFDIENLETHNTTSFADAPTRDTPIEDTGSRATPLEREHGKGKSFVYRGDKKADPSLNEDESLAPPNTFSPKRIKKFRTERDANIQRERTRSKSRATKSNDDALSIRPTVTSLNINGIANDTRIRMLEVFL